MTDAPRYVVEKYIVSIRDDDHDARFTVRRNGKAFYIKVSPSQFVNSPMMIDKFISFVKVLRSGKEVLDIYDTDVYEWVTAPFELLFAELAPNPPGDPKDIRITLHDHLFSEFFVFTLDVIDEKRCPRRIAAETSPYRPSYVRFDDNFLDELEAWTLFYDPARITLSFKDPEDALFKPSEKVLIDSGQTECFFKPCNSGVQIIRELETYRKIQAAGLDSQFNLCHVHGVVMDDCGFILGILLTYIDCGGCPLSTRIHPEELDDPIPAIRNRWLNQLDTTLTALHKAGIVWGDVKAENVLIDQDNNAWITDFGGGYTDGWVDREMAGTVEGDLAGMSKLKKFLFPSENSSGSQIHDRYGDTI
ncbi:uncharacterized protein TRIVIDRAFT_150869 [Trichoderma virens Gv29-8]|uniref:Protein kinase domain-containing protein n=1 Tax=Hypocrea virens (strain Gv29-8 / FGSC 10586) TaxID=413071 RepID=G9MTA1_HYPVG|nr:uncharacterized protein TRIVIDRAFT_150869 [Trichoderma virens Gv29-8]EHK22301.1 hypothetical protein TRIVIDRAFT_150869 [Trichoderma virens Gv29-8]UKZ47339.1 hypothetical protein TrVGV298_001557 [Trichoderma virens]